MRSNFGIRVPGDFSVGGKIVSAGLVALLFLATSGCSAARKPVTIIHKKGRGNIHAEPVARSASDKNGRALSKERNLSEEEWRKGFKNSIKAELREELLNEFRGIGASDPETDWTKRFRFGGDIRLRYENDRFDKNNALFSRISQGSDTQELENSLVNQHRFKYRVRFGTRARVNGKLDAVIRLSTGSTENPVSTNSTIGDHLNKDSIVLDRAYLKWKPWTFLSLDGGRIKNPWFSSDLVWDRDVSFEGLALDLMYAGKSYAPFLTLGVFPLQQAGPVSIKDGSEHLKWLYGAQMGLKHKNRSGVSFQFGTAFYNFSNVEGKLNNDPGRPGATDWSAHPFTQRGKNTLFFLDSEGTKVGLVSRYKELNIAGRLDFGFWNPVHIEFLADYVKNTAYDYGKIKDFTPDIDSFQEGDQPPPKGDRGFQVGVSVGYPKIEKAGQWKGFIRYKRLEADAVLDSFTDSDFHLGGTNAKGWILGAEFGLIKNSWLKLRWLSADEISGPPLTIDVLQVDFNARF